MSKQVENFNTFLWPCGLKSELYVTHESDVDQHFNIEKKIKTEQKITERLQLFLQTSESYNAFMESQFVTYHDNFFTSHCLDFDLIFNAFLID